LGFADSAGSLSYGARGTGDPPWGDDCRRKAQREIDDVPFGDVAPIAGYEVSRAWKEQVRHTCVVATRTSRRIVQDDLGGWQPGSERPLDERQRLRAAKRDRELAFRPLPVRDRRGDPVLRREILLNDPVLRADLSGG